MLNHLSIRNFAVVKSLDLDLEQGMTAITGETGAGKSIAIDALGLCLGARAEANMVRPGEEKAEIIASFNIQHSAAKNWLSQHDLDNDDECIIRRLISAEGRSRAFINGVPAPLQQLKELGQYLISIHGQHAHQQLLKPDVQRQLLDDYAQHPSLLVKVSDSYQELQQKHKLLRQLQQSQQHREARKQLLAYQVEELDDFALEQGEFQQLEAEHKRLSNSQALLEQSQLSFHQLYEAEEFNALAAIQTSCDRLQELQDSDPSLKPIVGILNEAAIQVDEAAQQIRDYVDSLEIDPLRMQQVEARYSQAMDLSRKHQVQPEGLYEHHQTLATEYKELQQDQDTLQELEHELTLLQQKYQDTALKLSKSRQKAAKQLAEAIQQHIRSMNMQHAQLSIEVQFDLQQTASAFGLDNIRFLIATNAGQHADVLDKVVSGGELSRIGLAIQVISSSTQAIPTMIFDEVDVGISGPTASIVGQLLRTLGQKTQVLCVTHLPQVAARAHQQKFVTKFSDSNSTETHIISLSEQERIEELARLLAGDKLTDTAIANAKDLLANQ